MILPMRFASFVFTFMLFVIWGIANGNITIHALHCLAACTCLLKLTACFDFLLSRPTLPVWVRWITLNVVLLYSFTSKTKLKRVDQNIKLAFKSCILIYRILYPRRLLIKVLYGEAPPWGPTPYVPLSYTFHWKMVLKKKHQELQAYHYLRVAAPSPWQRKNGEGSSLSLFFPCRGEGVATHRLSSHIPQLVNPLHFHKPEAWKRYPLLAGAPS